MIIVDDYLYRERDEGKQENVIEFSCPYKYTETVEKVLEKYKFKLTKKKKFR